MIQQQFEELMRKEHDAWDACFDEMRAIVHPIVVVLGRSISSDLQEEIEFACIRDLYRQQNEIESPEKLESLLKQMARNKVVDEVRRQKKVVLCDFAGEHDHNEEPTLREESDPAKEIQDFDDAQLLHTALEQLGDPCHPLLVAWFFEEVKQTELASRFGWSTKSVGVRISRCLERLKRICEKIWPDVNPLEGRS